MGKLNAPRTLPYSFKVTEIEGWCWLYDDSTRTYACSTTPLVWCEPLYFIAQDDSNTSFPDPGYWQASDVAKRKSEEVPVSIGAECAEKAAWDEARDEAGANWLL